MGEDAGSVGSVGASSLEEKYKSVLETIELYPEQIQESWDKVSAMELPEEYSDISSVVVCGMGGSALGARMVDSLVFDQLRIPLEIFNSYKLPNYASPKTLAILSSYSGTTEETLEGGYQALSREVKIFGITGGGKLKDVLIEANVPTYIIDPKNNPSGQPRMGIGFSFGAILALLAKLKVADIAKGEIEKGLKVMREVTTEYEVDSPTNLARKYARELKEKIPILVASEHLVGTVHTIKNQFNESSKTFSALYELPELNHHLMEGLANPKKLKEIFKFVFFSSKLYAERIQKRYSITGEVVEKNGVDHLVYVPYSDTKLSQVLETLVFGSFVVYYLSKDYRIDPTTIPWVDYFKGELAKV